MAEGEGFTLCSDTVTHPSNKFKVFLGHPVGLKLFHWTSASSVKKTGGQAQVEAEKEGKQGWARSALPPTWSDRRKHPGGSC